MIEKKWNKWRMSYGGKVLKFLWRRNLKRGIMSRSLTMDLTFIFTFYFILFSFVFLLFFYF